jgi:competence protein ComEC
LIYDTGIKQLASDSGASIVIPFLQSKGINHVAMMVVSHGDNDHYGGAHSILNQTKVDAVFTSVPEKFAPGVAEHCYAGKEWQWDGVAFKFLSPAFNSSFHDNDASCVLKISSGKNSVLLTGDIEKNAEKFLVSNSDLNASILVAPHHGSATSSTADFINATRPQYTLFPVGYLNRFRFPAKSVVTRYREVNAQLFATASSGAITFKIAPNSAIIEPTLYRNVYAKYWHDQ